jgi:signal transduction histidine kinase/CheY-like chemotaxis protein
MTKLNSDALPIGWIAIDSYGVIQALNTKAKEADVWLHKPEAGTNIFECLRSEDCKRWLNESPIQEKTYSLTTEKGGTWQFELAPADEAGGRQVWLKDQTELALLKSEVKHLQRDIERLDFAAQGANLGIWDFNPSVGQIIGNRTWATQKKLAHDDVFADDSLFSEIVNGIEKWASLVHPDDLEATSQKIQEHLDGKTDLYHAEFRIKCGDGSWKWILDQGKVFERDENGVPIRMNGIHVDVDKLKKLQQKLSETKNKAEVANRAKSIFLANMSHELRTPLNAILGYSQLMKNDSRLTPKHQEYLEIINRSGEHLLSLINDVLDMSKIDAGHNVVEHKWFNFREMIEEVRDLMQMKAMQKQLAFHCTLDDSAPHYALGDPVKTRQVLINLLGNAIKFTHYGCVTLKINSESCGPDKQRVWFKVSDSGIGIDASDLERIFKPFEQVGPDNTQNGTGLGLSISKQFVELMGGELTVSSQKSKGSVFGFALDLDSSEELVNVTDRKENESNILGLRSGTVSPKVLVAEDQINNQKLMMTLLSNAGFTVKIAKDGEEAVALHQSWEPDFIWMDRRMPNKDGLQATKEIRGASLNSDVKIVALTASVFNDEIEEMLQAGMDDFIRKPFLPQDLFNMMKKHLDIEYDYQEQTPKNDDIKTETVLLRKELLADLSKEQIEQIIDAAERGEQQELFCLFEQLISDSDSRSKLIELADSYQFDELYELFQN